MELDKELKEKFFALYIGQKVLCDNIIKNMLLNKSWNWRHDDFWLELKSLSEITYDDLKEVGYRIINRERNKKYDAFSLEDGKAWIRGGMKPIMGLSECADVVDYLRTRGYAIPFMGITVEKMIEANWIKLK